MTTAPGGRYCTPRFDLWPCSNPDYIRLSAMGQNRDAIGVSTRAYRVLSRELDGAGVEERPEQPVRFVRWLDPRPLIR